MQLRRHSFDTLSFATAPSTALRSTVTACDFSHTLSPLHYSIAHPWRLCSQVGGAHWGSGAGVATEEGRDGDHASLSSAAATNDDDDGDDGDDDEDDGEGGGGAEGDPRRLPPDLGTWRKSSWDRTLAAKVGRERKREGGGGVQVEV